MLFRVSIFHIIEHKNVKPSYNIVQYYNKKDVTIIQAFRLSEEVLAILLRCRA